MPKNQRTILTYGDSITWGCVPDSVNLKTMVFGRFDHDERWTGVLQSELGYDYRVIEEGLNGRTTVFDDPLLPGRNGQSYLLPCLLSHSPLDMVILMLGTNDLKPHLGLQAAPIAKGMRNLVKDVKNSGCGHNGSSVEILVMAPPPIVEGRGLLANSFIGSQRIAERLAEHYAQIAQLEDCHFVDAGGSIEVSEADGLHPDAEGHRILGKAVAEKVVEIFSD
ncbi:MAG: SGNH/GDSL hydrolase family protein [Verrucomicrobiota bacterium]